MRTLDEIIVHCSATRPYWMQGRPTEEKVDEIRRWHIEGRGWSDIGYHYLIDRDGGVLEGRPIERSGAHVRGRNARSIGVCLIGGHAAAATDTFNQHFTPEQDCALRDLIAALLREHGDLAVNGHNQYANKGCPGFNVHDWLEVLPEQPAAPVHPDPVERGGWLASLIAAIMAIFRRK